MKHQPKEYTWDEVRSLMKEIYSERVQTGYFNRDKVEMVFHDCNGYYWWTWNDFQFMCFYDRYFDGFQPTLFEYGGIAVECTEGFKNESTI